ncbi:hypothetical protein [Thalassomonas sp. RHCl1]|uniref:hypothetical protein n=1 Tax=Thalassomonas sp. RHCl1 TaxID=2995320 RepID=UPI00248BFCD9|nr:hypothetical protein [Thalassomonas sp. RHCl1]
MYLKLNSFTFLLWCLLTLGNVAQAALPVPGAVSSFEFDNEEVFDGGAAKLKWKAPSNHTGDIYYNIYWQQPNSSYLYPWRTVYTPGVIEDGFYVTSRTVSGLGAHTFHIEACNVEKKCGTRLSRSVEVVAPVPTAVNGFTLENTVLIDGGRIRMNWQAPSSHSDTDYYNIYWRQPGSQYDYPWVEKAAISLQTASRIITGLGSHTFGIEACNIENKCGTRISRSVEVIEELAELSVPELSFKSYPEQIEISSSGLGQYQVSWNDVAGATYYELHEEALGLLDKAPKTEQIYNALFWLRNKVSGEYFYKIRACRDSNDCSEYSSLKSIKVGIGEIGISSQTQESDIADLNPRTDLAFGGTVEFSNAISFTAKSRTNAKCEGIGNAECSKAMVFTGSVAELEDDREITIEFDMQIKNYAWLYEGNLWWILFQDWFRVDGTGTANSPLSALTIERVGDELYLQQVQRAYLWCENAPAAGMDMPARVQREENDCSNTQEKIVGQYKIADVNDSTYPQLTIVIEITEGGAGNPDSGMKVWVNEVLISDPELSHYQVKSYGPSVESVNNDKRLHRNHLYGVGIYHGYGFNSSQEFGEDNNLEVEISNLSFTNLFDGEYQPVAPDTMPSAKLENGNDIKLSWGRVSGATHYYSQVKINGGEWQGEEKHLMREKTFLNLPAGVYQYRLKACNKNLCSNYEQAPISSTITIH